MACPGADTLKSKSIPELKSELQKWKDKLPNLQGSRNRDKKRETNACIERYENEIKGRKPTKAPTSRPTTFNEVMCAAVRRHIAMDAKKLNWIKDYRIHKTKAGIYWMKYDYPMQYGGKDIMVEAHFHQNKAYDRIRIKRDGKQPCPVIEGPAVEAAWTRVATSPGQRPKRHQIKGPVRTDYRELHARQEYDNEMAMDESAAHSFLMDSDYVNGNGVGYEPVFGVGSGFDSQLVTVQALGLLIVVALLVLCCCAALCAGYGFILWKVIPFLRKRESAAAGRGKQRNESEHVRLEPNDHDTSEVN